MDNSKAGQDIMRGNWQMKLLLKYINMPGLDEMKCHESETGSVQMNVEGNAQRL